MTTKTTFLFALFFKCCVYSQNTFWENTFKDMSMKKFPPHITFDEKNISLLYQYNNTKCEFDLKPYNHETQDVKDLYKHTFTFLKDKVKPNIANPTVGDWKCISKKSDLKFYIEMYLVSLMKKNNVPRTEVAKFNNFIQLPFILKLIRDSITFSVDEDKIIDIKK